MNTSDEPNTKVFVGNIPYTTLNSELKFHMERAGEVVDIEIFKDQMGYSRGCGVVEYKTYLEARKAIEILNNSKLKNRHIIVKEDDTPKRKSINPQRKLAYQVKFENLPPGTTWVHLRDLCRHIGAIIRVDVIQDKHGQSKGIGMVTFERQQEAEEAIRLFNGAIFNDRYVTAVLEYLFPLCSFKVKYSTGGVHHTMTF
jgi:RNA recognition motif-containing protein